MKTYLDCLPCLMNQALKAARAATDDDRVHRRVLDAVAGMIPQISLGLTPPEIAQQGYKLIYQIIGDSDPFRRAKAEANQMALALYPRLKKVLAELLGVQVGDAVLKQQPPRGDSKQIPNSRRTDGKRN